MKRTVILLTLAMICTSTRCKLPSKEAQLPSDQKQAEQHTALTEETLEIYQTAYFASGCFWCVEAIFEHVKGVAEVHSGYAGGTEENPTYNQVAYGRTHHAEAVAVYYDPQIVSFDQLVEIFFGSHDPTTLNRQGPDRGTQYRSIAFYKNEAEKNSITAHIAQLESKKIYEKPIITEVKRFVRFYKAEDYHQDFERRNPNNSYIKNVSIPRLNRFKDGFPQYLKEVHDNTSQP